MPNLTDTEMLDVLTGAGLSEPSPHSHEYGRRGIITQRAIHQERVAVEADAWVDEHVEGNDDAPPR